MVARGPLGRPLRGPLPAPARGALPHVHDQAALSLHLLGMLVAFVVAAVLTAYFVVRLSAAIERRDAEIAAMREQATRTERLAALTTLAHAERRTSSVHRWERSPSPRKSSSACSMAWARIGAESLREDARLDLRAEVERCREILDRMASDSGEATGEAPVAVAVEGLVRDVLDALSADQAARVCVEGLPSWLPPPCRGGRSRARSRVWSGTPRRHAGARAGAVAGSRPMSARFASRFAMRDPDERRGPRAGRGAFFSTKPPAREWGSAVPGQHACRGSGWTSHYRLRARRRSHGPAPSCRAARSSGERAAVSPELARTLLLVDDDGGLPAPSRLRFRDRGWEVREAADLSGALRAAEDETPEFVVVDLRLPA